MRTDIAQATLDVLHSVEGASTDARVSFYPNRSFVTDFNLSHAPAWRPDPGIDTTPLPQATTSVGGLVYSAFVYNNSIWLAVHGSDPIQVTYLGATLEAHEAIRPAIGWQNVNVLQVAYTDNSTAYNQYTAYIDAAALRAGTAACVTSVEQIGAIGHYASLHWLAYNTFFALYVDEGGVGVAHISKSGSTWASDVWGVRFMFPETTLTEDDTDDAYWLNFSGATRLGEKDYLYLTAKLGHVVGVCRHSRLASWTDEFEAFPRDLSRFFVTNAITHDSRVYLAGQFQRYDTEGYFSTTLVYGLLLQSTDGRAFSIDRTAAFTGADSTATNSSALRWQAQIVQPPDAMYSTDDSLALVFSDCNRWMKSALHYGVTHDVRGLTVEGVENVDVDYASGSIQITLPSGGDYDGQISEGDIVRVEMLVVDADDAQQSIIIGTGVVTEYELSFEDGGASFRVQAQSLSWGLLEQLTHPMAFGLAGREAKYYKLDSLEEFETASEEGYVVFPFSVDFWNSGNVAPGTHAASTTYSYNSGDLVDVLDLVDYPEIDTLPLEIECYGWSRSGNPTPYEGGTGDQPSDLNAPNDRVQVKLYIQREDEADLIEITCATASGVSNTNFPQTWYKTAAGSYPVLLSARAADGLLAGDKIQQIDIQFVNDRTPNTAETVFFPERVDIPDLSMKVNSYKEDWIETDAPGPCLLAFDNFNGNSTGSIDADNPYKFYIITSGGTWGGIGWRLINCAGPTTPASFSVEVEVTNPSASAQMIFDASAAPAPVYNDSAMIAPSITTPGIYTFTNQLTASGLFDGYFGFRFGTNGQYATIEIRKIYTDTATLWDNTSGSVSCGSSCNQESENALSLVRIGVPLVMFAEKPFYSTAFQVQSKYQLSGAKAFGGVVGLASDGTNYIAAVASTDEIKLLKVRDALETELATYTYDFPDPSGWIQLRHIGGLFEVRVMNSASRTWSAPLISYRWQESDGNLLIDPELSHVGIYALRDAPYVRICGLDLTQSANVGILPIAHKLSEFDTSGIIRIEGCEYAYTGKDTVTTVMGPYQGRNTGAGFSYTNDGQSYSGQASEFTRFEWVDNSSNHNDFDGVYLATDTGVTRLTNDVDYKPFITTSDVQVFLKNRGRFFFDEQPADNIGEGTQCWLTNCLTGLTKIDGEASSHGKYTIAYQVSACDVVWLGFAATSGTPDLTDRDAISRIAANARATVEFPGDIEDASQSLSTTAWRVA